MSLPHITSLYDLYRSEEQPFRKVHRMVDLFESLIKTYTAVIMAEYFRRAEVSDAVKGLLANGLRTPSLGTWQYFSREIFKELHSAGQVFALSGFKVSFVELDKALNQSETNVVSFRNAYAHGATPSDAQCLQDITRYSAFLERLLTEAWIEESEITIREGKAYIQQQAASLCLHPILVERPEPDGPSLAFFNDSKDDKIGLLNYPLSKHYREKPFYREFQEYIPLQAWRKMATPDFLQRIEELTDAFKGRMVERGLMLEFVRKSGKGYLSVQGNPGIGKSALIAQFFKDLSREKMEGLQAVAYFINRGTAQARAEQMLAYLLRKTDDLFKQGRGILPEGNGLWDLQAQLFAKWRLWGEHAAGRRMLFLIDGLDEGVEGGILSYLPRENFEGVLFIYGSRPDGHPRLRDLWTELPTGHHRTLLLSGLGKDDIRALIYEVADKYAIGRESAWIDRVAERSEGNPLYLRLLCNDIENGGIALNDMAALPTEINAYYDAILNRYAGDREDGKELLRGLYVFAAAKDPLAFSQVGTINGVDEAALHRIASTLREVLVENPLTEDVLDYRLFHESFREYLVKQKQGEVEEAAERIIDYCAEWQKLEGSWEQRYALQHMATHLSESRKAERGEQLLTLLRDGSYWDTQKRVLRGYASSSDLCRRALLKASELKRTEDMLEAALCLVDLKYEEANEAPKVVEMVAGGEIDLALERITSFGGSDKDGLRRKFTLYMLCLMELTLLESRDKPFAKDHIERLLQHLDENLPVDHSILIWNDFFSSYLVFLMACRWAEMGLDYMVVYRRTDRWYTKWISENGPYTDLQLQLLLELARGISIEQEKNFTLGAISTELAKQGKVTEALETAQGISDEWEKCSALGDISTELAKQGKVKEALKTARGIYDEYWKSPALGVISTELAKQVKVKEADAVMLEALELARGISDGWEKIHTLTVISKELAKQGKVTEADAVMLEALETARGIIGEWKKSSALGDISTELAKQGKVAEADAVMLEALETARGISNEWDKSSALSNVSTELAKQGKVTEALETARGISGEWKKSSAHKVISTELAKQGKVTEAIETARGISDEREKCSALIAISTELTKQGKLKEAYAMMLEALDTELRIINLRDRNTSLVSISNELTKQDKVSDAYTVMLEALEMAHSIHHQLEKDTALITISTELAKQGNFSEALDSVRGISKDWDKYITLVAILSELAEQGKVSESNYVMLEALEIAREIIFDDTKIYALLAISTELTKQGKVTEADAVMLEALETTRGISNEWKKCSAIVAISNELAKHWKVAEADAVMLEAIESARGISGEWKKSYALRLISTELLKHGRVAEALETARGISDQDDKSPALAAISMELAKQGKVSEAYTVMVEALEMAHSIHDELKKDTALVTISIELAKQGKVTKALETARWISLESKKCYALGSIWSELAKQGKLTEAESVMKDTLANARGISDEIEKCYALRDISLELAKQGNLKLAEEIGLEIQSTSQRQTNWAIISRILMALKGNIDSLSIAKSFYSDEARLFYQQGWSQALTPKEANESLLQTALPELAYDSISIENILQAHALHCTFFAQTENKKIQRLNRSLNIQWALEIADKFPKYEGSQRLSTNLEDWIDEIPDEDDRDFVRSLARQVSKGKITETEFYESVKRMNA
jgi:hypothetical protein